MWIFTIYGMYSIACAMLTTNGKIDINRVEVRARTKQHLVNLQNRFPLIMGTLPIVHMKNRDYAWRITMAKEIWAPCLSELALEQTWSNFKNEASVNWRENGTGYNKALHRVWGEMAKLQESNRDFVDTFSK